MRKLIFAVLFLFSSLASAATIMTGNVTYNSVSITGAAFVIQNVFGGPSGWSSYIQLYPTVTDAKAGTNKLTDFNLPFAYTSGQDPITGCENALNALYGNALTVAP